MARGNHQTIIPARRATRRKTTTGRAEPSPTTNVAAPRCRSSVALPLFDVVVRHGRDLQAEESLICVEKMMTAMPA